jgi:hypothetical protein
VHQAHEAHASFGIRRTPRNVGDFARQIYDIRVVGHGASSISYASVLLGFLIVD